MKHTILDFCLLQAFIILAVTLTLVSHQSSATTTIPTPSSSFKTVADDGDNYNLVYPAGVRITNYSRIIIADTQNHQLKFIHSNGSLLALLGSGVSGFANSPLVDGKFKARHAQLNEPRMISMSNIENALYIAESGNHIIRKFNLWTGELTIVAGNLTAGFTNERIATTTMLNGPRGVTFDTTTRKDLYIADTLNHVIRKVDLSTGIISTVAGTAGVSGFTDGVPALNSRLNNPQAVAIDSSGNLYICDTGNNRIRKVTAATGLISTICGVGNGGIAGDGSAATSAMINSPRDIYLGLQNDLYIADSWNHRLRRVDFKTGLIETVAGTTSMSGVESVSVDIISKPGVSSMTITVADTNNQRIQVKEYSCNSTLFTISSNGSLCIDKVENSTAVDWKETDIGDYWLNDEVVCADNLLGENCEFKYCYGKIVAANSTACSNDSSNGVGYVEVLSVVKNISELNSKSVSFGEYQTSYEFPSTISDQLPISNSTTEIMLISSIYDPKSQSAHVSFSNSDKLKSTVMSISLYDRQSAQELKVSNLRDSISIRFFNISIGQSDHLDYTCAYYDTVKQVWTSSGLKTTILSYFNQTTNADSGSYQVILSIQCETSHLTSFGVIDTSLKKVIKVQTSTTNVNDQSSTIIGIAVGVVGGLIVIGVLVAVGILAVVLLLRSRRNHQQNRSKLQAKLQQQLASTSTAAASASTSV